MIYTALKWHSQGKSVGNLASRIRRNRPSVEELEASVEKLRRALSAIPGIWRIYLFGSCADLSHSCDSDIDIAVIFEDKAAYLAQRSNVLRMRVVTCLPWEPALLLRTDFEKRREVGGLSYEIFHRGRLIHDAGAEL